MAIERGGWRTGLVAVAKIDEGNAGQRHLNEGGASVAQRPRHTIKLQRQSASPLQLHHSKFCFKQVDLKAVDSRRHTATTALVHGDGLASACGSQRVCTHVTNTA